ncbi:AraC-type DNA-binding protein [Lachnospiraceae bacterium YSD2013]|nr:AraC-type DNA-binding protein [Lachnospiraceae bacterium YSD2013]
MKNRFETINRDENSLSMERETGVVHSAFSREYELFECIKAGNPALVRDKAQAYLNEGITMGFLSRDNLKQYRYWAISTIAVAIHYAILGGMDETDAFNLSDEYIRYIDSAASPEAIVNYLLEKAEDLTYGVFNSKANRAFSPAIRRCIHYIHVHLYKKITTDTLAAECRLSRSYLSVLFKREMGVPIHEYVLGEKLEAARIMMSEGVSLSEIAYRLSFCSETHFIGAYKKRYGDTPGKRK